MKKINLFLALLVGFSAVPAHATWWASINCKYSYDAPRSGFQAIDKKGSWDLVYSDCSDGDDKYSLTFKVNKVLNLDFLFDKGGNGSGLMKLTCLGTEITGTYGAGVVVGVGFGIAGAEIGGFESVIGGQSACIMVSGTIEAGGVEISPEMLVVKKLDKIDGK